MKLVWDKEPIAGNGRNSEGSFIRIPDGSIMFAYSRYTSDTAEDWDACDIAVLRSYDEGETWTEPEVIVTAKSYGVHNIMSVSCIYQKDGSIGVYFLIKELNGTIEFGRAISKDGKTFVSERCEHNGIPSYYVMNNDRVERFSDGKLYFPVARHIGNQGKFEECSTSMVFVSEDDGKTLKLLPHLFALPCVNKDCVGMQEPGIIEHKDGSVRLWARTMHGSQYESYSYDKMDTFTWPEASIFTSPNSPMELARNEETGVLYAIYNPYPRSTLADGRRYSWGRTPLVIRKSNDDGRTWNIPFVIEDDPDSGYCYPAVFFTKDNAMLCAYCRGDNVRGCLSRMGIMKISLDDID